MMEVLDRDSGFILIYTESPEEAEQIKKKLPEIPPAEYYAPRKGRFAWSWSVSRRTFRSKFPSEKPPQKRRDSQDLKDFFPEDAPGRANGFKVDSDAP